MSRQIQADIPIESADVVPSLIDKVRLFRQFQRAEMRLTLQIKSIERMLSGGHTCGEALREVAASDEFDGQATDDTQDGRAVNDIGDQSGHDTQPDGVAGIEPTDEDGPASCDNHRPDAVLAQFGAFPLIEARDQLHSHRLKAERGVKNAAAQLPIIEWIDTVKGCGHLGLGLIIGEAGDLTRYDNPAKLWKRMGLAVFDGRAQRRIAAKPDVARGRTKRQAADDAIAMGYSPRRRSLMHVIGDCLIKQNKNPDGSDGYYRALYLERKARETELHPDLSLIHRHKRAMRYMEKRFLLHLWQEWRRRASGNESTKHVLPADLVEV